MDIDDFKRQFGVRVQDARRRRRLTQEDLAEQIQRSTDTVSNIERGVSSTRLETAFRIAQVLEIPIIDLFDVELPGAMDRERRELLGKLVGLVRPESAEVLAAIVAQVEILLQIKAGNRPV